MGFGKHNHILLLLIHVQILRKQLAPPCFHESFDNPLAFSRIPEIIMIESRSKNRQFEKQNRARFMPLRDLENYEKLEKPEHSKKDAVTFMAITFISVSILCTALFLTIKN